MSPEATAGDRGQAEVVAFLSDPAAYTPPPERVERFETHGALVFLAGDEAWKIKRAVRFPYMDFSTLARRKAACAREVEINRRLAPELYLGSAPIARRRDGGLELVGAGEPVEWAVRMRRFDQSALLSRMTEAGELPAGLAGDLADAVIESHRTAPVVAGADGAPRMERLIASVGATLAEVDGILGAAGLQQLREGMAEHMRRAAGVLDERAATGSVRRCHGDLHLNNIVLWHGRPTLFDAIEFDEDFATVDTLYDLAFLLMDLDLRGRREVANAVLNRYLWRSGAELDLRGLAALPLFLGLRAAIRAMVTAEQAEQRQRETAAGEPDTRLRNEAVHYRDAALAYLAPAAPRLIAVGGLSGTGKSTLARALAPAAGPAPGAVLLRSDLERKALLSVAETTRLGADAYTEAAGAQVYAVLREKAARTLAAGHAAVVDAVFTHPRERTEIEAVAAQAGVPFAGLWLEAPAADLVARVEARRGDASDATGDVVHRQLARDVGALSSRWTRVDAGGNAAATLEAARALLADCL
jgi:aminoglycoside phosphotransferase family enzyme/predicted kinase